MSIFKRFVGKITSPKGLIRHNGSCWVRCHGILDVDVDTMEYIMDYSHPYQYQEWEQNWCGRWVKKPSWLGTHKPLRIGE